MSAEPQHAAASYPGGLHVRSSWGGSGQGPAVFALSEAGGRLVELGPIVSAGFERLCRAELRVETPGGAWSVRLASPIFDQPRAAYWDVPALLVVAYGFVTYAFAARSGDVAWTHRARTPLVALLISSRLDHVLVQGELETFALEADGTVRWRVAHSDVVASAELLGGRLVLTSVDGLRQVLDPATGTAAG